jgi:hypothetical protein
MLIYSMSVSADGFIADRQGGFGWTELGLELIRDVGSAPARRIVQARRYPALALDD